MLNNKNKVSKKIVNKQSNENASQKKNKSLRQSSSTIVFNNRQTKPTADEIEQLIIAKALRDAKAIERGELETRDLDELLAELEKK